MTLKEFDSLFDPNFIEEAEEAYQQAKKEAEGWTEEERQAMEKRYGR